MLKIFFYLKKRMRFSSAGITGGILIITIMSNIPLQPMTFNKPNPETRTASSGAVFPSGLKESKLPNGITYLVRPERGEGVVSVQVWVGAGSTYEDKTNAGLSHFLEHLIFKGSSKFPGDEISRLVETSGGVINAGTSKEYTVYYIDTVKDSLPIAVEILADAMENAVFPPEEIEKERPVVLEEIKRSEDDPGSVLYDTLSKTLYTTSPYRNRIIGDEKVVAGVTRDEIIRYYKKYYVPSNMVVSLAGDFEKEDAEKLIEKFFGAIRPPENSDVEGDAPSFLSVPRDYFKEKEPPRREKSSATTKNVAFIYASRANLAPDSLSGEQFSADITAHILGGGSSSRLYRTLREEKRLVYGISAGYYAQKGDGIFEISMVVEPSKFTDAKSAVAEEIKRLAQDGPTDDELLRAREVIKTQWLLGLEKAHDQASIMGYWKLQDNLAILENYIKNISSVGKEDVKNFVSSYLMKNNHVWASVEPKK